MRNGKEIDKHGTIRYFKNGEFHREDGPAYSDGDNFKSWWINGIRHREDGPAIIDVIGKEYWYHNIRADNKEQFYNEKWRKGILMDLV